MCLKRTRRNAARSRVNVTQRVSLMHRVHFYLHRDWGSRWRLAEVELAIRILLANLAEKHFELRPETWRERAAA